MVDPTGWTVTTTDKVNGRTLVPGTEVKLRNRRGRYRYLRTVTTPTSGWCDFIGPVGHEGWVSVPATDVVRVHRLRRTPAGELAHRRGA